VQVHTRIGSMLYSAIRSFALRWPDGITCPSCASTQAIKRGFDETEPARQCEKCHDCNRRCDALTDPRCAGHHQPLQGGEVVSGLQRIACVACTQGPRMGTPWP
jgi:hypothetical protein